MTTEKLTNWTVFWKILSVRYDKPKGHPKFFFYFVLINLIFGALGVYVSVVADWLKSGTPFDYRALNTNLATFYIAILAAACFDLALSRAKILRDTISIFSFFVLFLGLSALIVSYLIRLRYALPLTGLFTIVALLMWRISNAENDKLLKEEVSAADLTGGDIKSKIQGDLDGFKA